MKQVPDLTCNDLVVAGKAAWEYERCPGPESDPADGATHRGLTRFKFFTIRAGVYGHRGPPAAPPEGA
eukprot:143565-Hanusia_phi.AAC.1